MFLCYLHIYSSCNSRLPWCARIFYDWSLPTPLLYGTNCLLLVIFAPQLLRYLEDALFRIPLGIGGSLLGDCAFFYFLFLIGVLQVKSRKLFIGAEFIEFPSRIFEEAWCALIHCRVSLDNVQGFWEAQKMLRFYGVLVSLFCGAFGLKGTLRFFMILIFLFLSPSLR